MHIHILGICGTFMAGLAMLAKEQGHQVTGSDANVYPPMSTQLAAQGITLYQGFEPEHLNPKPDMVIIGNAMCRGNPLVEMILNEGMAFTSGPAWLAEHVLSGREVIAVAGTHGKTITSSMLAWILTAENLEPGYLIGGIPCNFERSAALGKAPYFVIEADEYDSAFFDKRSKFIHYLPRIAIINNLEYDHADIFPDMAAVRLQFHHFVRTLPSQGLLLKPYQDPEIEKVIQMGCWTAQESFSIDEGDWQAVNVAPDGSSFSLLYKGEEQGCLSWSFIGKHNVRNALAATAAAHAIGIDSQAAISALQSFKGVKRRLEVRGVKRGITVYDDFAHHPTAIATTLQGLRQKVGEARIIAVLEFASYTMLNGIHSENILSAFRDADRIIWASPKNSWDADQLAAEARTTIEVYADVSEIINAIVSSAQPGDHIVIMSNKSFGNIHDRLLENL